MSQSNSPNTNTKCSATSGKGQTDLSPANLTNCNINEVTQQLLLVSIANKTSIMIAENKKHMSTLSTMMSENNKKIDMILNGLPNLTVNNNNNNNQTIAGSTSESDEVKTPSKIAPNNSLTESSTPNKKGNQETSDTSTSKDTTNSSAIKINVGASSNNDNHQDSSNVKNSAAEHINISRTGNVAQTSITIDTDKKVIDIVMPKPEIGSIVTIDGKNVEDFLNKCETETNKKDLPGKGKKEYVAPSNSTSESVKDGSQKSYPNRDPIKDNRELLNHINNDTFLKEKDYLTHFIIIQSYSAHIEILDVINTARAIFKQAPDSYKTFLKGRLEYEELCCLLGGRVICPNERKFWDKFLDLSLVWARINTDVENEKSKPHSNYCYFCGKKGHYKDNCTILKSYLAQKLVKVNSKNRIVRPDGSYLKVNYKKGGILANLKSTSINPTISANNSSKNTNDKHSDLAKESSRVNPSPAKKGKTNSKTLSKDLNDEGSRFGHGDVRLLANKPLEEWSDKEIAVAVLEVIEIDPEFFGVNDSNTSKGVLINSLMELFEYAKSPGEDISFNRGHSKKNKNAEQRQKNKNLDITREMKKFSEFAYYHLSQPITERIRNTYQRLPEARKNFIALVRKLEVPVQAPAKPPVEASQPSAFVGFNTFSI